MSTGYGEGSVYQTKSGGWVAAIRLPNGKRKAFYGKTERAVRIKLNEFKKKPRLTGKNSTNLDIETFFLSWLENDLVNNLKPKSYDAKEYTIKKLIIPYFKKFKAGEIQPIDVQTFVNKLIGNGYAYSTVKKAYDTINQRYKLAVQRKELYDNPVVGIVMPKKSERPISEIRFFTEEELKNILEVANAKYPSGTPIYRLGCIIQFLAYTGMRIGEALALTWNDIDFDSNKIYINKNLVTIIDRESSNSRKMVVQNTLKTSSSNRVIPMSRNAKTALKSLKSANSQNELVFRTSNGTALDIRNLDRMFHKIQERAGIKEHGTLHSLRHTFATRLIEVGTDIKVVSKLLGHSDINITYNTYVHIIENQQVKAVDNIDLI